MGCISILTILILAESLKSISLLSGINYLDLFVVTDEFIVTHYDVLYLRNVHSQHRTYLQTSEATVPSIFIVMPSRAIPTNKIFKLIPCWPQNIYQWRSCFRRYKFLNTVYHTPFSWLLSTCFYIRPAAFH